MDDVFEQLRSAGVDPSTISRALDQAANEFRKLVEAQASQTPQPQAEQAAVLVGVITL